MGVKSEVSEVKKDTFPRLMVDKEDGEVCIFISDRECTVVKSGQKEGRISMPIGHVRTMVNFSIYEPFTGSITLSNE
jgi:hypothetical protein